MSKPAVIHLIVPSRSLITWILCGRRNYISASTGRENVTCKRCRKLMTEDDADRFSAVRQ